MRWVLETDHFKCFRPGGTGPSKEPIILLLGWAGASDRALVKYAHILSRWGYTTVRSVQPTSLLFAPLHLPRRLYALSLLRYLEKEKLHQRPLIVYAFSNGGGFVVEQLRILAEERSEAHAWLRGAVKGFVFDSAPCYMHRSMGPRVIAASQEPGIKRTVTMATLTAMNSLTPVLRMGKIDRAQEYWEAMVDLDWSRPSLILFSQDDDLCDAIKLQELIAEKRRRGQRVLSVCWEKSEHCAHLKHHNEEYMSVLEEFLKDVDGDDELHDHPSFHRRARL